MLLYLLFIILAMNQKKVSIKDIAKRLNVSITTVSFVLNGKAKEKRISEELTQKILTLVEETGYKPNQLAKGLRTGKTSTIGLMVEDISNPFFSSVASLIEENAYKKGYKIIYCSTKNSPRKAKELIRMFRDTNVDGFIITPPEGIEAEIKSCIANEFPLVLFDRYFPEISTDYVVVDNLDSTYQATKHLLEQGFRKIAFITLASEQVQMHDRLEGYLKGIAEQSLTPYVKKIQYNNPKDQIIKSIYSFLKKSPELDCVFFATNYLAFDGLEAIIQLGLKIPTDIGIITFDDHDLFRLYNPSITAVAQPVNEMALSVIDILLKKLDIPDKPIEKLKLSGRLIKRDSTART